MQAGERTRRNWAIALAASVVIHLLGLGFVRFAPVPSADEADDATPVAILRITKRASSAQVRRGEAETAPVSDAKPVRVAATTMKTARGPSALAPRRAIAARPRAHSAAPIESGTSGTAPAVGTNPAGAPATAAAAGPSPGPAPTITAEMLASLNERMRSAIPSGAPQTMQRYTTDMGTLAVRPDPNRWTVANYPLPQRGLFAHALIVRVGREAVAVRAIQRIGKAYICIGYLAKVDERNPDATLAGPYIGPCKKAWREQLGLVPKPTPSPAPTAGQSE